MNEILSYGVLKEKDINTQKSLMKDWMSTHKVNEVRVGLGMDSSKFSQYVSSLGIPKKPSPNNGKVAASQEELDKLKDDIATYEKFMSLPVYQRNELLPIYLSNFEATGLAELWSVKPQKVYAHRHQLRKAEEKKNKPTKTPKPRGQKVETKKQEIPKPMAVKEIVEVAKSEIVSTTEEPISVNSEFNFSITEKGHAKSIAKKLELLSSILEDGEEYELVLTLKK